MDGTFVTKTEEKGRKGERKQKRKKNRFENSERKEGKERGRFDWIYSPPQGLGGMVWRREMAEDKRERETGSEGEKTGKMEKSGERKEKGREGKEERRQRERGKREGCLEGLHIFFPFFFFSSI